MDNDDDDDDVCDHRSHLDSLRREQKPTGQSEGYYQYHMMEAALLFAMLTSKDKLNFSTFVFLSTNPI